MTVAAYLLPLISVLVGFWALALGTHLKLIDYPGHLHKTHDRPTPLVGGFAVALPLLAFCGLTLWQTHGSQLFAALTMAIGGAFLMGFFDDRRHLPSLFRLLYGAALTLTSIAITPTFIVFNFDFTFLSAPLWLAPLAVAFSVLVIVGMMNAINMVDGMNGLASGLCLIWSLFLLIYAPPEIFSLVVLLALCLFVTLIFNLRGKFFLGDSGSCVSGMAIGLLTVYSYNMTADRLYADVVVAWFIIPVVDCLRLMAVRALSRRSPMSPDTDHLHHRLQRLIPRRWVVPAVWAMVAVPGAVAVAFPSITLPAVLTVTGLYAVVLVLSSSRFSARRKAYVFEEPATLTE